MIPNDRIGSDQLDPEMQIKQRPVISLFTGAGGLDLGFEAAGFETRVAVEFDHDAVKTIRANRDWSVIDADIHSPAASSRNILKTANLDCGDDSVLIGGPPCQPFSKSGFWARGEALRLADPRASTLGAYLRVLQDTLPRVFLLENVPGIAFTSKDEGLCFLQNELRKLNKRKGCSYSFKAALLRAVDFGIPQDRQRVFIIGERTGKECVFPKPTHAEFDDEQLVNGLKTPLTAWDAIGDLQDDDDPSLRVTGKWARLLPTIPEGSNYLHHTSRGKGLPLFGWRRRYWSFLLKLAKSRPSWTIAAQPGPAIGPFHWKNRRLSRREMGRLQTFPDNYVVGGTLRAAQRQIGNAVPSALAEILALEIERQFFARNGMRSTEPTLVPAYRPGMPNPEPVSKVPREYQSLAGRHDPHPGTGLGYRALARATQSK
jgi:DNA (cytosine-5)-methyltransferase 1